MANYWILFVFLFFLSIFLTNLIYKKQTGLLADNYISRKWLNIINIVSRISNIVTAICAVVSLFLKLYGN